MQAFPLLTRLGEIVDGQKRGWAELMYLESQAMHITMLHLMGEQIPSLAVHDSIIVPISKEHEATSVLTRWYRRFTNATPVLVSHFPEGHKEPSSLATVHNGDVARDDPIDGSFDPQSGSGDEDEVWKKEDFNF